MKKKPKLSFLFPAIPVIIGSLVIFSPFLFFGKVFFWGTPSLQFVPWWSWAWKSIGQGIVPLWNPYLGMGSPLIANYQSALFYPPNWLSGLLYALGGTPLLVRGISFLVVFHIIIAGMGVVFVTRALRFNQFSQAVCGVSFALSGYLIARAGFLSINAAIAWFPWILYAAMKLSERRNYSNVFILGVVVGLQLLAGHAQTSFYTLIYTSVWFVYFVLNTNDFDYLNNSLSSNIIERVRNLLGFLARPIGLFILAIFIGIGLSSIQLFPTAEYLLQSQRSAAVGYEYAMTYSFWPWRFLGFIAPDLFGNPATGDYWGYANYWEDAIYFGLIPFIFSILVVIRTIFKKGNYLNSQNVGIKPIKDRKSFRLFLIFTVFIVFVLALGKNTPIFPWLYRHIPTFNMFQAPTRISFLAIFALLLLSGIGIEEWRRPINRALYWTRLGTMGAFAIMLGSWVAWLVFDEIHPTFVKAMGLAGIWALSAGILALIAPQSEDTVSFGKWTPWHIAVIFVISIDLISAGWGLNPGVNIDFYKGVPATALQVKKMLNGGRLYFPPKEENTIKYNRFFTFDTFSPAEDWEKMRLTLLANQNMFYEIPEVNNYDPIIQARYDFWMTHMIELPLYLQERLLDLMNVSVVERIDENQLIGVEFSNRKGAYQYITWVPCSIYVNKPNEAWKTLTSEKFDPQMYLIVEAEPPTEEEACLFSGEEPKLETIIDSPNHIEVIIDAKHNGWLFISDAWYPGWRVYIDNKRSELYRANYLFRGVKIETGKHTLKMVYRPLSFYIGATISGVMWLILLYYGLTVWMSRRKIRYLN